MDWYSALGGTSSYIYIPPKRKILYTFRRPAVRTPYGMHQLVDTTRHYHVQHISTHLHVIGFQHTRLASPRFAWSASVAAEV